LTKLNQAELPGLFDLMEAENLPRICFYHLVGTGRGRSLAAEALSHDETRHTVDLIADRARRLQASGFKPEILTVDNQADGPYLYLKARREGDADLAGRILELLRLNGGNSAGHGIAAISWNGEVHPDQFWRSVVLGSVKNQPFAEIWHNPDHELLMALKNKKAHLTGRCRLCVFLDMCGGGLRARAAAAGDLWGPDPACYLTDEEISTELAKPSGFQATRA
jgi:radical SAM protein with 4Fe4S-binding SPASM domain